MMTTRSQRKSSLSLGELLLQVLKVEWTHHAYPGEPYSVGAAAEIALNEILDYAHEQGCIVRTVNNDDVKDLIVG